MTEVRKTAKAFNTIHVIIKGRQRAEGYPNANGTETVIANFSIDALLFISMVDAEDVAGAYPNASFDELVIIRLPPETTRRCCPTYSRVLKH